MVEQNPKVAPEVIWRQLDENAVVVSPKVGKVRVFNGSGTLIWQMLAQNEPLAAICERLVQTYDVTPEQAEADLQRFVADLTQRGLLVW